MRASGGLEAGRGPLKKKKENFRRKALQKSRGKVNRELSKTPVICGGRPESLLTQQPGLKNKLKKKQRGRLEKLKSHKKSRLKKGEGGELCKAGSQAKGGDTGERGGGPKQK